MSLPIRGQRPEVTVQTAVSKMGKMLKITTYRAENSTATTTGLEKPDQSLRNCWRFIVNNSEIQKLPGGSVIGGLHIFVSFASKRWTRLYQRKNSLYLGGGGKKKPFRNMLEHSGFLNKDFPQKKTM